MQFVVRTAEIMECSADDIECIKIAAMLHDIGKIAIPDHILLSPTSSRSKNTTSSRPTARSAMTS